MTMKHKTAILASLASTLTWLFLTLPAAGQQLSARVPTLELFLRPRGFSERAVKLEAGPWRILVTNRTALKQMRLRLEAAGEPPESAAISDETVARSVRQTSSALVNLLPGEYLLREMTQGTAACRITVVAK